MAAPVTLEDLTAEFAAWQGRNQDVPKDHDALELDMFANLSAAQAYWLQDFIVRWDAVQDADDAARKGA